MSSILEQDTVGAFCRHTHVELAGATHGPLANLTFGAKDIYDIAGHKTGFGCPDWLRTHAAAARTAPAVLRLLEAGARMVGKTHTDEMTYSLNGENPHYGTPVNVNAPGRIPGGSSSGSAAAVAAGLVDFAIGSDTGGSVRAPASYCGIFGMRPTHGRIPLEDVCPLAPSFDTAGWFTRDPVLLDRVGRVLLRDSSPASAPGRLLVAQDAFALAGDSVMNALKPAIARLRDLRGDLLPVVVASAGLRQWFEDFRILQGAEIWEQHGAWVTRVRPRFGPGVRERFDWVPTIPTEAVAGAKTRREGVLRRMADLLCDNAVLVLPTMPGIAPLRNAASAQQDDFRARAMSLLCVAGLARLPQVSLPLAKLDGCPLGLSLVAAQGNDTLLLALAGQLAEYFRA